MGVEIVQSTIAEASRNKFKEGMFNQVKCAETASKRRDRFCKENVTGHLGQRGVFRNAGTRKVRRERRLPL